MAAQAEGSADRLIRVCGCGDRRGASLTVCGLPRSRSRVLVWDCVEGSHGVVSYVELSACLLRRQHLRVAALHLMRPVAGRPLALHCHYPAHVPVLAAIVGGGGWSGCAQL